jgi:hypothetical protein
VRTKVQVGSKVEEICKEYCSPYSFIPPMLAQCEAGCKLIASEVEKSSP